MKTTNKKAYQKLALTYGLLMGLLMILLSVIVYATDSYLEKSLWTTILAVFIGFGGIFYAIYQYRGQLGGYISLGQAIKLGVAVALISGVIAALSNYIFMTYIEPDTIEKMLELSRKQMDENTPNLSDEQMEMTLEMSRKFMQPWIMAATGVLWTVFTGVIYSLISGLILQKKEPIA